MLPLEILIQRGVLMQYDIVLTKSANDGYIARPVLWPEVVVSGTNEAEALSAIRKALTEFLAETRIVQVEIPANVEASDDPWLRFAGMWSDVPDEQWERFQAAIAANRHLVDQQVNANNANGMS